MDAPSLTYSKRPMMIQPLTRAKFENLSPEKQTTFAKLWQEEKQVRRKATTWDHPLLQDPEEFLLYRMWSSKHQAKEWDQEYRAYKASQ